MKSISKYGAKIRCGAFPGGQRHLPSGTSGTVWKTRKNPDRFGQPYPYLRRAGHDRHRCERDEDGDPIKVGGNNLTFNDEGMAKFQKAYDELMAAENILNINRIKIDSATLEKMNASGKDTLNINDMVVLEKFFDFVE